MDKAEPWKDELARCYKSGKTELATALDVDARQ